jgi:phenylalanyl-tRNA synthetase beta chain
MRAGTRGGDITEGQRGWESPAGWAGELGADRPAWAGRVFGFEIALDPAAGAEFSFRVLPATPAVERDLALVLPAGVRAAAVEAIMRRYGGPLLEAVRVFDEYRSRELQGRSVAWRLVFRAPDRTLRDEEVDGVIRATVQALKEGLGVELRES